MLSRTDQDDGEQRDRDIPPPAATGFVIEPERSTDDDPQKEVRTNQVIQVDIVVGLEAPEVVP
jgi:hypothetical protein